MGESEYRHQRDFETRIKPVHSFFKIEARFFLPLFILCTIIIVESEGYNDEDSGDVLH